MQRTKTDNVSVSKAISGGWGRKPYVEKKKMDSVLGKHKEEREKKKNMAGTEISQIFFFLFFFIFFLFFFLLFSKNNVGQ
jgi:hypothetical protein